MRFPFCLALALLSGCSLVRGAPPRPPASTFDAPVRASAGRPPDGSGRSGLRPYDQVITPAAITRSGLFVTHRIGDELFFEIPASALDREMLVLAEPEESTRQSQNAIFRGGQTLVVRWERLGDRIVLRQRKHDAAADTTVAIWREVEGMQNGALLAVLPVRAYGADSAAVVDVTDLFLSGPRELTGLESVARDRSWLESVVAFPRNVEIGATQTGRAPAGPGDRGGGGGGSANADRTVTQRIHWSLMLLPDRPMQPRHEDARVDFISTSYTDYGTAQHGIKERSLIHRYRLEPSDTAAFRAGDLVAPRRADHVLGRSRHFRLAPAVGRAGGRRVERSLPGGGVQGRHPGPAGSSGRSRVQPPRRPPLGHLLEAVFRGQCHRRADGGPALGGNS